MISAHSFNLENKARHVLIILEHVISNNTSKPWVRCCDHSLLLMRMIGIEIIVTKEILRIWYQGFPLDGKYCQNPSRHWKDKMNGLVTLLDNSPDLIKATLTLARKIWINCKGSPCVIYLEKQNVCFWLQTAVNGGSEHHTSRTKTWVREGRIHSNRQVSSLTVEQETWNNQVGGCIKKLTRLTKDVHNKQHINK